MDGDQLAQSGHLNSHKCKNANFYSLTEKLRNQFNLIRTELSVVRSQAPTFDPGPELVKKHHL